KKALIVAWKKSVNARDSAMSSDIIALIEAAREFLPTQLLSDIRPEFLANVADSGHSQFDCSPARIPARVERFGAPCLHDEGRREIGQKQTVSGHCSAMLISRHQGSTGGIPRAPPDPGFGGAEISGILVVECPYR